MSEYQYYEFQAIDRSLTKAEMAELRAISSRATITPTRFQNVYNFGSLKADPYQLLERYFDAYVYVANWGSHELALRLPRAALSIEIAARYCVADSTATVRATETHLILAFDAAVDGGGYGDYGDDDEEGEIWMPSLISLRAGILAGDLRTLYLAWLRCAQDELLDEYAVEPPVPPGLGHLSAPLSAFADFMHLDEDLIAVAAQRSGALREPALSPDQVLRWLSSMPAPEKDGLLLRVMQGEANGVQAALLRRCRQAQAPSDTAPPPEAPGRTVADLLAAAEAHATVRAREEAAQAARERARLEREAAAARAIYLDQLAEREPEIWRQIEALIGMMRAKEYEQAVQLLVDLRDLSLRRQTAPTFRAQLAELRARHSTKSSLLRRLDTAGLTTG